MTPGVPFPPNLCAHDAQVIGAVGDSKNKLSSQIKSSSQALTQELDIGIKLLETQLSTIQQETEENKQQLIKLIVGEGQFSADRLVAIISGLVVTQRRQGVTLDEITHIRQILESPRTIFKLIWFGFWGCFSDVCRDCWSWTVRQVKRG